MQTRFLTVFPLCLHTTGLLLEDDRGRVIGRTRLDDLTQKTFHLSKERKDWDALRKGFYMRKHVTNPPQGDVDFVSEDRKKVFLTAEECLRYDLYKRFGVHTLDEVAELIAGTFEPVNSGISPLPRDPATDGEKPLGGFSVSGVSYEKAGFCESATGIIPPKPAVVPEPTAPITVEVVTTPLSKDLMKIAKPQPAKKATTAKKAAKTKPAPVVAAPAKVMGKESTLAAITKAQEILARGGLAIKILAERIGISVAATQRIIDDRDDLFVMRPNSKIYLV